MLETLGSILATRQYPGRGNLIVRTTSGQLCLGYLLTGRSAASRDRHFVLGQDNAILVRGRDGSSGDDLRHYSALIRRGNWTVVGNGSQVEDIADALASQSSFIDAWSQHDYEPDGPIYTARIWMVHDALTRAAWHGYALRTERATSAADRVVWQIGDVPAGNGSIMTTYSGSSHDLLGAHYPVDFATSAEQPEEIAKELWLAIDPAVRVAVFISPLEGPDRNPIVVQ